MTKSDHDHIQDTQIALLEAGGKAMKMFLPLLTMIAMSAGGFAWNASGKIAVLEAQLDKSNQEIEKLRSTDTKLEDDHGIIQTWVEVNYVSQKENSYTIKEVSEAMERLNNHLDSHK